MSHSDPDLAGGRQLDPEARRRIARAVASGQAVADASEAAAAVALARSAQRRLRSRMLPTALAVSGGTTVVWLVLVALPATVGSGVHPAALLAGLAVGVLLFSVVLLLGLRQLRLVRQAERRNRRLLASSGGQ
ncbi:MAG TPA: hypothetical protein VFA46_19055 [Actinomycetes bacterium]|nr:hypothetical protein [Actinomycetes bacterium]